MESNGVQGTREIQVKRNCSGWRMELNQLWRMGLRLRGQNWPGVSVKLLRDRLSSNFHVSLDLGKEDRWGHIL